MQLRKKPEKKIRTSTGFEPLTCDQNPLKSWTFFRLLTQLHKLRSQLPCWNKLLRYKTNFLPEETKFRTDTSPQAINYHFLLSLRNFAANYFANFRRKSKLFCSKNAGSLLKLLLQSSPLLKRSFLLLATLEKRRSLGWVNFRKDFWYGYDGQGEKRDNREF